MLLFSAVKCAIFAFTWTKTTNEVNLNGQNLCYRANMFCFSEWISFVFSSASIQHIWESTTRLSPMRSPHCKQLKETLTSLFSFFFTKWRDNQNSTKTNHKLLDDDWGWPDGGLCTLSIFSLNLLPREPSPHSQICSVCVSVECRRSFIVACRLRLYFWKSKKNIFFHSSLSFLFQRVRDTLRFAADKFPYMHKLEERD